jgi:hypothetical protein
MHRTNHTLRSHALGRRAVGVVGAAAVALSLVIAAPWPARSDIALVVVDVSAVAKGWRASKLIGSGIMNDQNERIGSLDELIVDQENVLFAVLQVGGFLGIGGHLVAVPYKSLVLDHPGGKVVLPGATKDQLKRLPEFKYS